MKKYYTFKILIFSILLYFKQSHRHYKFYALSPGIGYIIHFHLFYIHKNNLNLEYCFLINSSDLEILNKLSYLELYL